MDAFILAERFVRFLNTEWHDDPDPGPMLEFYADWAHEERLFTLTGGDQLLALQGLFVAWSWYVQRPEDFGICAPYITGLADIPLEERELPWLLDRRWWREILGQR